MMTDTYIDDELTPEDLDTLTSDILSSSFITTEVKEARESKKEKLFRELYEGTKAIFDSEKYKEYLRTMALFHSYSLNNCILISHQKPNATRVASITNWNQLGRTINEGEKGIKIIAPAFSKRKILETVVDEEGKTKIEEREVQYTGFRAAYVFDISQTKGKDLTIIAPKELIGNVAMYEDIKGILEKLAPVPVSYEEIPGEAKGYFSLPENKIVIQQNMPQEQTIKTLIHELGHSILHNKSNVQDRQTKEVQAESIAYAVCSYLGINSGEYTFPYLASWSKDKSLPELKESLGIIHDTAGDLIERIDQELLHIDRIEIYHRIESEVGNYEADIDINNYRRVYIGPYDNQSPDDIYNQFRISQTNELRGYIPVVTDVIVIHHEDREKAYCINTFGFEEIEDFKRSKQEVQKHEKQKSKCR